MEKRKSLNDDPRVPGSFRDPSGFLFVIGGQVYRQINECYRENYEYLMQSGLYEALLQDGLLLSHTEVGIEAKEPSRAYKVIQPEQLPFISYPYEWCFSQLKDAALVTLAVLKKAYAFGMVLKDASVYNVQFVKNRPIFIDTLSFEKYLVGTPWVAYRQFCQHFLAPLALMSYRDLRLNQLLKIYLDGIPLELTSSLLPWRSRFSFSLLVHLHLHARSQKHFASRQLPLRHGKMGANAFQGLVDNLESAVMRLKTRSQITPWADYYTDTNYSPDAFEHKKELVAQFLDKINPRAICDVGANTGEFSRLASQRHIPTISMDMDPLAVERNYLKCLESGDIRILPLCLDLTNLSSGIGWENQERTSFLERWSGDTVLALGLVHHLAIGNNLPLGKIAQFFNRIGQWLIIEFIPKNDSQLQKMLATREDIFPNYSRQDFEEEFSAYYDINCCDSIHDTQRILYLMKSK